MVGNNRDVDFEAHEYQEFYEHHAFEPILERDAFNVNEYIPRFGWAFDQIEFLNPKSLLDLGCLDGSFALTVAKQLHIPSIGVDLTKDGIALANTRSKSSGVPANFYQGTLEEHLARFVKKELKFDVITMFELIEHIKDVPKVLALIDQVLSPGGSVLVSTPAFESPVYGADDEKNKCHVRLYTTEKKDYEKKNKYGHMRKATSIYQEIGASRIKEVGIHNHLINIRYQ